MRQKLSEIIIKAFENACNQGLLPQMPLPKGHQISYPKQREHGDLASNLALVAAGPAKMPPRKIADILTGLLKEEPVFFKVEVAGPGFINFFIAERYWQEHLLEINRLGQDYGKSRVGHGKRVLVEFVSANPTGPLHVGHGRGAAVGDSLSRILRYAGFDVEREYYINDVGNQMRTLGSSVYARYQELLGKSIEFPKDYYQGEYIKEIAQGIINEKGRAFFEVPLEECLQFFIDRAVHDIFTGIKQDLADFDVDFENWFSERQLHESGLVQSTIQEFMKRGVIYEQDGALWFKTTQFGDEKDRVVRRSNGVLTYFAADMAYHRQKISRNYDMMVDIWGADHHGYIPRIKAVLQALGVEPDRLKVLLVQFVTLLENGVPKSMSTRSGEFITLREVLDEVGKDACRFMFLTRKCDSHLDFDLEVAKQQTQENPVYYVQYAHARLASILRNAAEQGLDLNTDQDLSLLNTQEDLDILKHLEIFTEVVEDSALTFEPHKISYYLTELAGLFHVYYTKHRFIDDNKAVTKARLFLAKAIKQVVKNGLELLGVTALEKM
jgi:arginyl-tRNA synthetase